jgi:murein L,D-transpeptidase YafK
MGLNLNFILCLGFFVACLSGCEQKAIIYNSQQATPLLIPPKASIAEEEKQTAVDYIMVQKRDKVISLWKNGRIIKTYPVLAFGADPIGHKVREGDEKTPEGSYIIDTKHPSQQFQKFLRISYPNEIDKANAKRLGVSAGGHVGIHGDKGGVEGFFQRFDKRWTDGCIAIRNADIEEIFEMVDIGTPIMIKP